MPRPSLASRPYALPDLIAHKYIGLTRRAFEDFRSKGKLPQPTRLGTYKTDDLEDAYEDLLRELEPRPKPEPSSIAAVYLFASREQPIEEVKLLKIGMSVRPEQRAREMYRVHLWHVFMKKEDARYVERRVHNRFAAQRTRLQQDPMIPGNGTTEWFFVGFEEAKAAILEEVEALKDDTRPAEKH